MSGPAHTELLDDPPSACGEGDRFHDLFVRFQRPLLSFFTRRTSDGGTAEQLSQETFLRIFRHWNSFDSTRKASAWVFAIAGNLYRDWLRHRSRGEIAAAADLPDLSTERDPESLALARDSREAVQRAVRALPEKYRTVLLMKHFKRMKYSDMAVELGLQEGTVKSRLHTAAGLLREALGREGWLP